MFDWKEYLTVANESLEKGDQAHFRNAISRAYYACYKEADEWLLMNPSLKVNLRKASPHTNVWKSLQKITQLKQAGQLGFRLKLRRQDADYNSNLFFSEIDVKEAITNATRIIEDIENHFKHTSQDQ